MNGRVLISQSNLTAAFVTESIGFRTGIRQRQEICFDQGTAVESTQRAQQMPCKSIKTHWIGSVTTELSSIRRKRGGTSRFPTTS